MAFLNYINPNYKTNMGLVIEKERKKRQDCGVFQTSTWASDCPATTCYYVHNILSKKKIFKVKG